MNKTDLISKLAAEGGISKRQAARLLEIVLKSISDTLAEGDNVRILKFGTFKVADRPARVGRNPQTGKAITIRATKKASFSAGTGLRSAVSGTKTGGGGPGGKA